MKKLLSFFMLSSLSLNAMESIARVVRNSTNRTITVEEETLKPQEEKEFSLVDNTIITIKDTSGELEPMSPQIWPRTKLIEVSTYRYESLGKTVLNQEQKSTRPLIIKRNVINDLLICARGATKSYDKNIAFLKEEDAVITDISTSISTIEVLAAQRSIRTNPNGIGPDQITLSTRGWFPQDFDRALITLEKDTEGLLIENEIRPGGPSQLVIKQLKLVKKD